MSERVILACSGGLDTPVGAGLLEDLGNSPARAGAHGVGRVAATGWRGTRSPYDVPLATCGQGDTFDQSLAGGYVPWWGLPTRIAAQPDLLARVEPTSQRDLPS